MAMSSNCCLNMMSPVPDSNSIPSAKSLISRAAENKKPMRRRSPKLMTSLACAIIGLEMALTTPVSMPNINLSHEMSLMPTNNDKALASELVEPINAKGGKWSDKRRCPSWNLNSFETIVPENLPRPSAHRRWESVANANSQGHRLAPPVKTITVIKTRAGCFSM